MRPAAVERRPFVGVHSLYNQIAILNGMGSKGCSLAPWFAKELASNLISNKTINVVSLGFILIGHAYHHIKVARERYL